ncbi:MAG: hypothetical protein EHM61_11755 [Acidobacteria bacterium]|nr:MAG: hypothetical protein EHM61_11755 [Acidobacteriota bacterium]
MLPGVNGFQWQFGHLVFLGTFFAVVVVIFSTSALGFLRSFKRLGSDENEALMWKHHFMDLPQEERACRHSMSGELKGRICPNAFDCRQCSTHRSLVQLGSSAGTQGEELAGMTYRSDRFYHRGHTWVEEHSDGTVTIGLDDFATKLFGAPDEIVLPQPGDRITTNGVGWRVRKAGVDVRVLAPVAGEVLEAGTPEQPWSLRVRPESPLSEARHLLSGDDIGPWIRHELGRLQGMASTVEVGAVLADGGELVDDVSTAFDQRDWDHVCSSFFLQP